jgi:hypothetical protein
VDRQPVSGAARAAGEGATVMTEAELIETHADDAAKAMRKILAAAVAFGRGENQKAVAACRIAAKFMDDFLTDEWAVGLGGVAAFRFHRLKATLAAVIEGDRS